MGDHATGAVSVERPAQDGVESPAAGEGRQLPVSAICNAQQ
jgi:hypothetical protein